MRLYEKLSLTFTAIAILVAGWIGFLQYSINRQLVDINYEPSLTVQYVSPIADAAGIISGLELKNQGKTNVTYYGFSLSPKGTTENKLVFNSSDSATIAPGDSISLVGSPKIDFMKVVEGFAQSANNSQTLLEVAFETPDGQKYLMETPITNIVENGIVKAVFSGSTYTKSDWEVSGVK